MNRKTPALDAAAMPVPPLDLNRPAAEQIFTSLKAAILSTRLTPGRMISENEVGQLFGASRTPVREAFSLLREDGLLITRPSRGTYVSKLSEKQIRGAQFLREALEVSVVERLCLEGLKDIHRTRLVKALELQKRAMQAGDTSAFQEQDDRFHAILADATGFERIENLLIKEKSVLDRLRVLSLDDTNQMEQLFSEHTGIFEAIENGYSGQAVDRIKRHLRRVLKTLSQLIEANQDYFE